MFAINFVHLAPKLKRHVIAIGSISTRLTIAINFVHLAINLTQHEIAIESPGQLEGLKIRGCQYYLVGIICPPWLR
jgi:hypothetical protein